jgi:DNA-binding NtrC family response regulator
MPKGRILAVDDQRYFRELIEGTLAEQGFEVRTASSGDEALAILEQSVFDIVITDLVMPVMSGTELVQRVKERNPEQDIVVVTGVVDVKSAVDAMRLGATDYLLKPYDRDMLVASLESILQRRRLAAERDRLLAENIEYLGERSLSVRQGARAVLPVLARRAG